ncbi:MAG: flavin reductase family protein [Saprospiraceae bacterium]|jgi:flavin reductase (DIM6/NTAB) family NADH-FMN oxidoreductase RutF|nr:flavin reductase family protein [Saprospiraceae bacterium]
MKKQIVPGTISTKDLHQYIIGAVAPRPIAFVSTLDENGIANLAPYSFFNAFSSNPPILVFSSNRRVSDNTTKDTLHNVRQTRECVVNVVPFSIVRQMSLASVEFPSEVSEFEKVGLTPEPSQTIQAPRVAESPVNMECRVKDIIELGEHGGAGHLIICEVTLISVSESVMTEQRLDPNKLDLMGRLGRNYYVRASGAALMEIYQSVTEIPVGFDGLPEHIRTSSVLTGNQLAALASQVRTPAAEDVERIKEEKGLWMGDSMLEKHVKAATLIEEGKVWDAFCLLMTAS